jgi:hypothetical protein
MVTDDDLARVDITHEDIMQVFKRPDHVMFFSDVPAGKHGEDEMFTHWALGPVLLTRDANLLAKSNAVALLKHLDTMPELVNDWEVLRLQHFASGWVEHLAFRALDADLQPTRMFRVIKHWCDGLEEYPVADEEHYYKLRRQEELDNIYRTIEHKIGWWPRPIQGIEDQVHQWLWQNRQQALELTNDTTVADPTEDDVRAALVALGYRIPPKDEE